MRQYNTPVITPYDGFELEDEEEKLPVLGPESEAAKQFSTTVRHIGHGCHSVVVSLNGIEFINTTGEFFGTYYYQLGEGKALISVLCIVNGRLSIVNVEITDTETRYAVVVSHGKRPDVFLGRITEEGIAESKRQYGGQVIAKIGHWRLERCFLDSQPYGSWNIIGFEAGGFVITGAEAKAFFKHILNTETAWHSENKCERKVIILDYLERMFPRYMDPELQETVMSLLRRRMDF